MFKLVIIKTWALPYKFESCRALQFEEWIQEDVQSEN